MSIFTGPRFGIFPGDQSLFRVFFQGQNKYRVFSGFFRISGVTGHPVQTTRSNTQQENNGKRATTTVITRNGKFIYLFIYIFTTEKNNKNTS